MKTRATQFGVLQLAFSSLLLLLLIAGLSSCYYDVESELYPPGGTSCDSLANNYTLDVVPVLSRHCLSCHQPQAAQGGISLSPYTSLITHVNSGLLMCTVRHTAGCSAMPLGGGKIPECDIQILQNWIDAGAPNN